MPRRAHPFLSLHPPHDASRTQRFVCRDTISHLNVAAALWQQGIEPGDIILNWPKGPDDDESVLTPIDADLDRDDLVVYLTRPALDDGEWDTRRQLTRAYTDLEAHALRRCRPYFGYLDRAMLKLDPQIQALLPSGYESRSMISFYMRMWATYKELHGRAANGRHSRMPKDLRTAAFVLNLPALWDGGPALLCAFAMDGAIAAGWSSILRYKHPEWLLAPGFRMVELIVTEIPERPTHPRFGLDWQIEELIHTTA